MTFLRRALTVSRAITLGPMAALDGDLEHLAQDRAPRIAPGDQGAAALIGQSRCTMMESASTGSPPMRMSIFTMGEIQWPCMW